MKISTWNVNGIRAREAQLLEWVQNESPDVLCLQEIKSPLAKIPARLCDMEGYWCYWHGEGGYSGVGLHIRKDFCPEKPAFFHPQFDYESRIVAAQLGDLVVASVYVPNGGKDFDAKMQFLESLSVYVSEVHERGLRLILCGDMNVARAEMDVHPKERKPRAIGQLPIERDAFERILGKGVVDIGRALDPTNDQLFTWWAPWRNLRQRNIGWRLDYVLATESIASRATQSAVFREIGTSDHAPVVVTFSQS